jgi:hypothetical protein
MKEPLRNHQTRKMVRGGVVPMAALAEMVLVEIGVSGPSWIVMPMRGSTLYQPARL